MRSPEHGKGEMISKIAEYKKLGIAAAALEALFMNSASARELEPGERRALEERIETIAERGEEVHGSFDFNGMEFTVEGGYRTDRSGKTDIGLVYEYTGDPANKKDDVRIYNFYSYRGDDMRPEGHHVDWEYGGTEGNRILREQLAAVGKTAGAKNNMLDNRMTGFHYLLAEGLVATDLADRDLLTAYHGDYVVSMQKGAREEKKPVKFTGGPSLSFSFEATPHGRTNKDDEFTYEIKGGHRKAEEIRNPDVQGEVRIRKGKVEAEVEKDEDADE